MYKPIAAVLIISITIFVVWFSPALNDLWSLEGLAYWVMFFFFIFGVTVFFFAITEHLEDEAFKKRNNGQMIKHKGRRYKSMDELEDYLGWGKNRGE